MPSKLATPSVFPGRRTSGLLLMAVLLAVAAALAYGELRRPRVPVSEPILATGSAGVLTTMNSAGRRGAYFLPRRYEDQALPLLVALHGAGSSGTAMVALLREAADRERFVVVAPDSRIAPNGAPTWEVPTRPGETSEDAEHVRRCVEELRQMSGVRIDERRTLVAGHSGGGSTAPFLASTDGFYAAFAVLHGGAFPLAFGPRRTRGWFSTGLADKLRPVGRVAADAQAVRAVGFGAIDFRTFPGGHEVSSDELNALIQWWLTATASD